MSAVIIAKEASLPIAAGGIMDHRYQHGFQWQPRSRTSTWFLVRTIYTDTLRGQKKTLETLKLDF